MKTINVHQVDAFTDAIFGGNPAGVVTNADGLSDDDMYGLGQPGENSITIRTHFASDNIIAFCLFTGSTQSGLVHAAKQLGIIDRQQAKIVVEQGNFVGRPSFAEINHDSATDKLVVEATAAQVFSASMELN